MNHGARPSKKDHRDYSFHPTFGSIAPDRFPDSYLTDAGGMFDQNALGLPFGCTDFSQAELADDILKKLTYHAQELDAVTHANALGGFDIRNSLRAALKLNWITAFFTVEMNGLDFFDSIRLAMLSGAPEERSISWGTPWFLEWEQAAYSKDNVSAIMPNLKSLSTTGLPWHNSVFVGWKTINGTPYLINKSWQGTNVGDQGYIYFPREVVNNVMQIPGTVAFTATRIPLNPSSIQTVTLSTVQYVASLLRNLFALSYGYVASITRPS